MQNTKYLAFLFTVKKIANIDLVAYFFVVYIQ